jgi:hypothetical protein
MNFKKGVALGVLIVLCIQSFVCFADKAEVNIQYIIPEKMVKSFNRTCVFLESSDLEKFSIDEKMHTFEKETTAKFLKAPGTIHFAPDNSERWQRSMT